MDFTKLHYQYNPLLIGNVWDVTSAKIAEKLGFTAIGTSSAAIAALSGYKDGENISFKELYWLVERIALNTKIPLSVDLESGYHRNGQKVIEYIKKLADLGVVGVNIEDSLVGAQRQLLNETEFAKKVFAVKNQLVSDNVEMFLNIRTDAFLLGQSNAVDETKKRVRLFEGAGADGVFIPCIEKEVDIDVIVKHTKLPVNVMCMPKLPDFDRLRELGVKRISMGNFLFEKIYNNLELTLKSVINTQSFSRVF